MGKVYDKLNNCLECVRKQTDFVPKVAIVLGSGLGNYADNIKVECEIEYSSIEGFPVSTVPGHAGKFIFGYVDDVPVVCMKGRVHYYEGYDLSDVVLPIRLMGLLGAKILFLTNASGGINKAFKAGDFMMITDHIATLFPNPLIGPNVDELGTRFPDMSHVYNLELQDIIRESAKELDIDLKEGVYVQLTGPSFESPAEIRMLRTLGVDAVGMSTVVVAIAANHMGMKVCGISCITNMSTGISKTKLSGEEVIEIANKVSGNFEKLVSELVREIKK